MFKSDEIHDQTETQTRMRVEIKLKIHYRYWNLLYKDDKITSNID